MTCGRHIEIHRYHDNELRPAQREEVAEHLLSCSDCRRLADELAGLSRLLSQAARVEAPVDMVVELRRSREFGRDRSIIRIAGWLTATAAAILVGSLATWPTSSAEASTSPDSWEIMAVGPVTSVRADANSDSVLLAQWMADEFTTSGGDTK